MLRSTPSLPLPPAHSFPASPSPTSAPPRPSPPPSAPRSNRSRRAHALVTLVLPDTAVRVFVLDFDSLPASPAEAIPVLRFRLRKMVPFDVEHAGVSYQVLSQERPRASSRCWPPSARPHPRRIRSRRPRRRLRARRGAALQPRRTCRGRLLWKPCSPPTSAQLALTTSITNGSDLLLYRTLDLPADNAARLAEIQRGIAVAAAYFEDKLQGPRAACTTPARCPPPTSPVPSPIPTSTSSKSPPLLRPAPPHRQGPIGFAGIAGALAGVA